MRSLTRCRFARRSMRVSRAGGASWRHWGAAPRTQVHTSSRVRAEPSFLNGSTATYAEQMHAAWRRDPSSVHASWAAYFQTGKFDSPTANPSVCGDGGDGDALFRLGLLMEAYQTLGHYEANLDPLSLTEPHHVPMLDPAHWGFTGADMDRTFDLVNSKYVSGFIRGDHPISTLRGIVERLKETYCGTIGVEYMHMDDPNEVHWVRDRMETPTKWQFPADDKLVILDRLMWADYFEDFLMRKYRTAKRFGLDGAESLIPCMKAVIDEAGEAGVENIVMGMPHRGRLNVLSTVVRKPLPQIFAEFNGQFTADEVVTSGDVKYHLGTSFTRPTRHGKSIHLSLLANPSHLEAVNPVVLGKVRAQQFYSNDKERKRSMGIILHGDASFAGQGVVSECFDFTDLNGYTTGGTVHIVVNNQIGFTTDPRDSRSTRYCTAVAKAANAPIFHVNGDDPEAVVWVSQLATQYRQRFGKDVVIDMICYRRHGHNEMDDPTFTQPRMYRKIAKHPKTVDLYGKRLTEEGVLTEETFAKMSDSVKSVLAEAHQAAPTHKFTQGSWLDKDSTWGGFFSPKQVSKIRNTGVPMDTLKEVGKALCSVPEGFKLHRQLTKTLSMREKMFAEELPLDWATGELLAYGTLLKEGIVVRLSGQDVERGTFTHRHAVMTDQETSQRYSQLASLGRFRAQNSSLSEYAVLGFEYGYSMQSPHSLVLWEAQFGDFANGAQIVIDQFISCGEEKWLRQSGLVLLLPHGYDGMGPEHSSARPERFLQLSNSDPTHIPDFSQQTQFGQLNQVQGSNFQVCNITTPANYFHALRRQIHRQFRKPLIVFTPKRLLRHPKAVSPLDEFDDLGDEDIRFNRVYGEQFHGTDVDAEDGIRHVVFCSGQVYYDLLQHRVENKIRDTVLVRLEQLAPFPWDRVRTEIMRYPNAKVITWAQEEHRNMGAWTFVKAHFDTLSDKLSLPVIGYAGRDVSASPAAGYEPLHKKQHQALLSQCFGR